MDMKYQLARMARERPDRFFSTFGLGGDELYLRDLWTAMAKNHPPEEQVPSEGISSAVHEDVLVLVLPVPEQSNEAYFLGVARTPDGCRVFCLERSAEEGITMLIELAADSRSNFGVGPSPDPHAFALAVRKLVA